MGRAVDYQELVPTHARLGKIAKVLNVLLIVLGVTAGIALIALIVNVDGKTKENLRRLKVFEANARGDPAEWTTEYTKLQVEHRYQMKQVSETVDVIREGEYMKQLVEAFIGYLPEERNKIAQNKKDIEEENKKLETFIDTFLVKDKAGKPSYLKYYSKYQAGYVGGGCAETSCGSQPASKTSLDVCISYCHEKRKEGYYSVSYNPSDKRCYCSTNAHDFVEKKGYFHYRFPRAIYGKAE